MNCHDVGSYLKAHWLPILSRSIAIYFIWAFHLQVGFPPYRPMTPTGATYLGLFAFFFLLPLAHRLKLGKLIEFEAKVERVQEEVKAVRTETRELVLTVSNIVNAVSNTVSQNVVVNPLPDQEEKQIAREDLSITLPPDSDPSGHYSDISEYVGTSEPDLHYALARLRIDLERELRRILGIGKRQIPDLSSKLKIRFISTRLMFRRLASSKPRYKNIQSSIDYLLQICNAAIHGQRVPEDSAHEALDMGIRILRELEKEAKV